jgi:hypothetical protein
MTGYGVGAQAQQSWRVDIAGGPFVRDRGVADEECQLRLDEDAPACLPSAQNARTCSKQRSSQNECASGSGSRPEDSPPSL